MKMFGLLKHAEGAQANIILLNYYITRGLWTAMPVLIKVKETGQTNQHSYVEKIFQNIAILREKAKSVLTASHFLTKRLFFFLLFKPLYNAY